MEPAVTATELWIMLGIVLGLALAGFFALIILVYRNNPKLDVGEMRRAITGFVIILFGLIPVTVFVPTGVNISPEISGLFAGMVTTIVGFYFGSRRPAPTPTE